MADATSTSPTNPSQPPAANPGGKSPLDVLEEILGNVPPSQQAAGAPTDKQTTPSPDEAAKAQVDAEEQQRIQQQIAERAAADQAQLQQKIEELKDIEKTPAYQARVQQDAEKAQATAAETADQEGFEIVQLGHTKI